jgi:tripartite-type tricarboxylate transporter receptor subunit TctC
MEKQLKQPFTVVNRAGAAGTVGMQSVTTARPDGYTVLMALQSISTLPEVDTLFGRTPTFQRAQFIPIARFTADPCIVFVRTEAPWKTFKELVDDAKKRPNEIIYSSSGLYGATHIPAEMLLRVTGTKMKHLPTTGGAPAITAVLGGHADLFFTVASLGSPHVKSGKFKALAVSSDKRLPEYPDMPTLKELGYNMEFYGWSGLFVPRNTPAPMVAAITAAVRAAATSDDFKGAMQKINAELAYIDGKEFADWWERESAMLAAEVKAIGKIESK